MSRARGRESTAVSATYCDLAELDSEDLDEILSLFPSIRIKACPPHFLGSSSSQPPRRTGAEMAEMGGGGGAGSPRGRTRLLSRTQYLASPFCLASHPQVRSTALWSVVRRQFLLARIINMFRPRNAVRLVIRDGVLVEEPLRASFAVGFTDDPPPVMSSRERDVRANGEGLSGAYMPPAGSPPLLLAPPPPQPPPLPPPTQPMTPTVASMHIPELTRRTSSLATPHGVMAPATTAPLRTAAGASAARLHGSSFAAIKDSTALLEAQGEQLRALVEAVNSMAGRMAAIERLAAGGAAGLAPAPGDGLLAGGKRGGAPAASLGALEEEVG